MNEIVEHVKKMIDKECYIHNLGNNVYEVSDTKFVINVQTYITNMVMYNACIRVIGGHSVYTFSEDAAKFLWFYIENHNSEIKEEDNKKAAQFILEMIK